MKKTYAVEVQYEAPYPKTVSFPVIASSFGMAAHEAFKLFKKGKYTSKRQSRIKFEVVCTGTLVEEKEEDQDELQRK
jgi:hypothetical protein